MIRLLSLFYRICDRNPFRGNTFGAVFQSHSLFAFEEDAKLPVPVKQVDNCRDFYFLELNYDPPAKMMNKKRIFHCLKRLNSLLSLKEMWSQTYYFLN